MLNKFKLLKGSMLHKIFCSSFQQTPKIINLCLKFKGSHNLFFDQSLYVNLILVTILMANVSA